MLGKPAGRARRWRCCGCFPGRPHQVLTAVVLVADKTESRLSSSQVSFRPIGNAEAEAYWNSGEPADKAGGYAIQGAGAIHLVSAGQLFRCDGSAALRNRGTADECWNQNSGGLLQTGKEKSR